MIAGSRRGPSGQAELGLGDVAHPAPVDGTAGLALDQALDRHVLGEHQARGSGRRPGSRRRRPGDRAARRPAPGAATRRRRRSRTPPCAGRRRSARSAPPRRSSRRRSAPRPTVRDQRVVVAAVDVDQVVGVGRGQVRLDSHEAPVAGFRGQAVVRQLQPLAVVGPDRPDRDDTSIWEAADIHHLQARPVQPALLWRCSLTAGARRTAAEPRARRMLRLLGRLQC